MAFINNRLSVFNLGDGFNRSALTEQILNQTQSLAYRDTHQLTLNGGEAWLFFYGVIVFWGVAEDERQALLARLKPLITGSPNAAEQEHYIFALNSDSFAIQKDSFKLKDDDPLVRLAISHALAQSVKLNAYESSAQRAIQDHAELPKALAQTGKIPLSRHEIAKIRGRLFSVKHDIIVNYGLPDVPEFFWEYPEQQPIYELTARYLEISPRVDLLSKKLETIHELFEMLADEQKHRQSAFLEWIIIWLIAIEIIMFVVQEIVALTPKA